MARKGAGGSTPTPIDEGRVFLDREQLFAALTVKTEEFELPGGGKVLLRGLPLEEGMDTMKQDDSAGTRVRKILLAAIVEPKLDIGDLELLAESSMGLLQEMVDVVLRLSGLGGIANQALEGALGQADDFLPKTPSGT